MDPLKDIRSQFGQRIGRAWEMLTEGWRELLSRSGSALTHFDIPTRTNEDQERGQEFPRWSLLAAESWETAQSVIIRLEVPGMTKEDLDVSIVGTQLVVRGIKRSERENEARRYDVMERAYGRFERTIPLHVEIDRERVEVTYKDGVITAILPKIEPTPPRRLTVS